MKLVHTAAPCTMPLPESAPNALTSISHNPLAVASTEIIPVFYVELQGLKKQVAERLDELDRDCASIGALIESALPPEASDTAE